METTDEPLKCETKEIKQECWDDSQSEDLNITSETNECDPFDGTVTNFCIKTEETDIKDEPEMIELSSIENGEIWTPSYDKTGDEVLKPNDVQQENSELSDSNSAKKNESPISHPLDAPTYKCDSCGFETKWKVNLVKHKLDHKRSSKIPKYECNTCDYTTKHQGYLLRHMLMHLNPPEKKTYTCNVCDYTAPYKSVINKHSVIHSDLQYKCDVCNFKTKLKASLNRHKLIHKVVRMYKCPACSYQTKYKGSLKLHKLIHPQLNPDIYKCGESSCTTQDTDKA